MRIKHSGACNDLAHRKERRLYYETIFIVNPDVSQENTEALTDGLIQRVEKAGGRIVKREYWGSRPLAYAINKRKRGHYTLLVTDGEPQAIKALEEGIRLEERIMRFLTTSITKLSDDPSPLMRRRSSTAETQETKSEAQDEAPAEASADVAQSSEETVSEASA
ncbi:MAG: 30S ribosomal protein S6 [Zetaproteobacteria bacterium CG_4_9_14_3_um_filter_49_83]|nr:MAG: 30S ribosomal protein S6 [Zetaproteobacteria bacterium CG1_02_49_23]PIQ32681.1 MAG: 30S ribosomal protein S6 [Zetaproteobacteria bacterium CG17_big_fil_post_rev_8_21_14_2_50_50_13]PIV30754.1 MAG: 30S ribosomal protein S6 [Zetaproteobacteria bacterium CG02_land_8_20_14_3_00_50_9]PIY55286.1 MAG: 30S ribosomal protein S6 [Zetaproteobacteria bacterium CG_4_10_14_0_8_um_filter_49_80]PJA36098.1 MAG: 30S ribosomal protein S6 [Zetaproteobacteria bacterium CG_4_9_14_3_um_filter_49_83]